MHILTQLYIFQHRTIGQNADNCGIYRKSLKPRRPLSQAETSKAGVGSGGRELGGGSYSYLSSADVEPEQRARVA